jgi:hypothetical protein
VREHPLAPQRAASASHASRIPTASSTRSSSSSASTWSGTHQRWVASRQPSLPVTAAASLKRSTAVPKSPLCRATTPRIPRWTECAARTAPPRAAALAPNARGRDQADPDGRQRPPSAGVPTAPRAHTGW